MMSSPQEDVSVETFRQYLRINTMHPNPNYGEAVKFLQNLAADLGLTCRVFTYAPNNPVVLMSWIGQDPTLPSLFLSSHMDVVPVFREYWKYDPFSAHKDESGNIYARGAQDMKCVGIQYIEAIRRLKSNGQTFLRTIHISFLPDEEVGSALGMELFSASTDFKELNVGFGLDEGVASPTAQYLVFNAERVQWWLKVTCPGPVGHGSRLIENTAAEKFHAVLNKFMTFREENVVRLRNDPNLDIGDVITVNLTMISGGVQVNVIPSQLVAHFDIRVPPTCNLKACQLMFERFVHEASPDNTVEWMEFDDESHITSTNEDNKWWKIFSNTLKSMKLEFSVRTFFGGTDGHLVRKFGIPVLGFSPMNNTPVLLHEHNEYLNEATYLQGVDIYCNLIRALANNQP